MKVLLDEIFGPDNFRTEIIWKRSTAHSDTKQGRKLHGRIHDVILFYSKGPEWVWNPIYTDHAEAYVASKYPYTEEESGRRYGLWDMTAPGGANKGNPHYELMGVTRYWRYSEKTIAGLIEEGRVVQPGPGKVPRFKRYLDESEGIPLQDVWTDIDPINSQALERLGYPTQKPEALLERIINTSTDPGDLVLDCFSGSGTTPLVSDRLGRRWVAVECGKLGVYISQRRLLALTEGNGAQAKLADPQPFELCSAGLYDNALLEDLSRESYERYEAFCLELFGCRAGEHTVAGIRMAGTRKGDPVHVFPFHETKAEMGPGYIEDLHARLRSKISGVVYVVVPDSHRDPGLFEDVIRLDDNTYFVLRIPYSVIEALHERDFELPAQPDSRDEINEALDSFGFDFVEIPEVKFTHKQDKGFLRIKIGSFYRGGLDPDEVDELDDQGRGDLTMVMVDTAYDGQAFRLGQHRFGDELAANDWVFEVDLSEAGDQTLIIFMDGAGNESKEAVSLKKPAPKQSGARTAATKKTEVKRTGAKA